jgi:hypothetical protein
MLIGWAFPHLFGIEKAALYFVMKIQSDINYLLHEFLERSGSSIRSVNAARASGMSLGDYFNDVQGFERRLLRLPNIGRKSFDEIIYAIENGIASGLIQSISSMESPITSSLEANKILSNQGRLATEINPRIEKLCNMSLHHFLASSAASVRALNATISSGFRISDYLDNREAFRKNLLLTPNLGKGTAKEIIDLIELAIEDASSGCGGASTAAIANEEVKIPGPVKPKNLEERIFSIYNKKLSERTRAIISMRGAIENSDPKTLEEIASLQKVTRERIRQIEKKGRHVISVLLEPYRQEVIEAWLEYFPAERFGSAVTESEIKLLWGETPIHLRLAIFCLDINPTEILDNKFDSYGAGWLLDEKLKLGIKYIENFLSARSPDAPPMPIDYVAQQADVTIETLSPILRLIQNAQEYLGYLINKPSYRRKKRTVILHKLLSRLRENGPCPLELLLSEYQTEQTGIPCSSRDALVVMAEQGKALFLNCYEYGWYPLPPYPKCKSQEYICELQGINTVEELDSADVENSTDTGNEVRTIEEQLEVILANGPMTFDELREAFLEKDHSKAKGSVGPILIYSDRFVRVAPGIYALAARANDDDSIVRGEELLLSDKHCKLYCQARWAGEPSNLYPYWGKTTMELQWAKLLAGQKNQMLFSSLMAVAHVEEWEIFEDQKVYWRQKQASAAKFLLEEPPGMLDFYAYTARQVVAASVQAVNEGRTSWMACNRAAGKRVDDRHACSLLALLIRLGVTQGARHWQLAHKTSNQANDIVGRMLEIIASQPDITFPHFFSELGALPQPASEGSWLENAKIIQDLRVSGTVPVAPIPELQDEPLPFDISAQILSICRRRQI